MVNVAVMESFLRSIIEESPAPNSGESGDINQDPTKKREKKVYANRSWKQMKMKRISFLTDGVIYDYFISLP